MKLRILVFAIVVLAMGTLVSLNGCGGSGGSTPSPPPGKIQHVVVIFQENRTPDNLFQDPILIAHGADIAWLQDLGPETDTRIPGRTISPIASTSIRPPCSFRRSRRL
jgi:hypothetical protein